MPEMLPLPLTHADACALKKRIDDAVTDALAHAIAWRTEVPPIDGGLEYLEQDQIVDGVIKRVRIKLDRSKLKIGKHVDGPRYDPAMIRHEISFALHYAAVRLGLYETGVEARLIIALTRAEEEIARLRGAADPVAEAAAAVGAVVLAAATGAR